MFATYQVEEVVLPVGLAVDSFTRAGGPDRHIFPQSGALEERKYISNSHY